MRVYTVHENPAYVDDRRIVLVKEGFCWPALFFTIIWAIYRRVWLGLGVYIIGLVVMAALEASFASDQGVIYLLNLAFALFVAAEANDWRRRSLGKRGYKEVAVVIGEALEDAERRYFEMEHDAREVARARQAPPPPPPSADAPEPAGAL
jgi:hypothetical protein